MGNMIFIQKWLHPAQLPSGAKFHRHFQRTPCYAVYEEGESESVLVWFGEGDGDGERKIFCRYH
jgi:hypothetical protein